MAIGVDLKPVVAGMNTMTAAIDRLAAVGERTLDYLERRDEEGS
jgi:hypothetical protein